MKIKQHIHQADDIHKIHYSSMGDCSNSPLAILFVHGGPGAGVQESDYELFKNSSLPVVFVDQRGSGKSTPQGELKNNTTWDLIQDFEAIRKKHGIQKWYLCGGSWGSTLSLTYTIQHPEIIEGFILWGIFLCRKKELNWFYQFGANMIFPDEYEKYIADFNEKEKENVLESHYKRIHQSDTKASWKAVQRWVRWEAMNSFLECKEEQIDSFLDRNVAIPMARLETEYFVNAAFFNEDNYILNNIQKIKDIKGDIVQGRYDTICPFTSAWELHKQLPKTTLHISPKASHDASEKENFHKIQSLIESISL